MYAWFDSTIIAILHSTSTLSHNYQKDPYCYDHNILVQESYGEADIVVTHNYKSKGPGKLHNFITEN